MGNAWKLWSIYRSNSRRVEGCFACLEPLARWFPHSRDCFSDCILTLPLRWRGLHNISIVLSIIVVLPILLHGMHNYLNSNLTQWSLSRHFIFICFHSSLCSFIIILAVCAVHKSNKYDVVWISGISCITYTNIFLDNIMIMSDMQRTENQGSVPLCSNKCVTFRWRSLQASSSERPKVDLCSAIDLCICVNDLGAEEAFTQVYKTFHLLWFYAVTFVIRIKYTSNAVNGSFIFRDPYPE